MSKPLRFSLQKNESEKLNQIKCELCLELKRLALRRGWNQRQMAWHLGTSEACISRVIRLKVDEVTFNQLFQYLVILAPGFRVLISTS